MSSYGMLEPTIRDILRVISPLGEDWSPRFQIIDELRAVVQSVESLRGATVEPYGSFVSNLFTRWGDLDISIELANGSYIPSAGKKHKQTLLKDLLKALRKRGGWHNLQFVANARVPILKFQSNYLNISCDLSINNLSGQMKSKLLFWINEIDGRFRNMVLLVKEWAKAHGINDSKSGTLNSYCLSLLIIFHFQTCVPALLPPMKEIYPGNMVDDLTGVRAVAERHVEEVCAENITKFRSDKSRKRNQSSLSELFISFLAKFSDISLRALEQGICLYTGQWEPIDSNMRWLPQTYALYVEDPFEQPANSARTVGSRQLVRISEVFRTTHHVLISGNQNQHSLIATLARPQVSQLFARMPANPSGYNSGYIATPRPQMHSPMQAQYQNQHRRVNRRPNDILVNRSVNSSQGRGQQFWRPRSDK
ncbi:protein HESO1 [Rhododendron vialii]|uniref:protein HESO1 n=1 Tax=Rhododendron vialii TaxID=182163 RepID=UPI00265E9F31|nr:protein HESO1 [Rhododendron vialii]XP_058207140.1 protein HESO1 [Rhododendron vialii]XP_058207141.1 protein HESO1 [Rhododendron vialii]XP_058207142.1 protein HESO1 [Rhododendron vialii]